MKDSGPVAAIIQARMDSSRLPGKSLAKVYGDYSLIELVLMRVRAARMVDIVVLATSEDKNCDPLVELADAVGGVSVFRGDDNDVLGRFAGAIEEYGPETVVRICADNPLVSPEEIDRLVEFFQEEDFDYATNSAKQCGLPDGLGCEIIKASVLKKISGCIETQVYREHVTLYIIEHKEKFRVGHLHASPELCFPELRLDIDTGEDLEKVQRFCRQLPSEKAPFWSSREIVELSKRFFAAGQ